MGPRLLGDDPFGHSGKQPARGGTGASRQPYSTKLMGRHSRCPLWERSGTPRGEVAQTSMILTTTPNEPRGRSLMDAGRPKLAACPACPRKVLGKNP
jgi:hypothetical protein